MTQQLAPQPSQSPHEPVTSENAAFVFYDIESLNNAFTMCLYDRTRAVVHVFYLVDQPEIYGHALDTTQAEQTIRQGNPAMGTHIELRFYDLQTFEANHQLAWMVGLSDAELVNDLHSYSSYGPDYRPACDTDPGYDPLFAHPYICGYNSDQYDTTILSLYLHDAMESPRRALLNKQPANTDYMPAKAHLIRAHNDMMFSEDYRKFMPRYLTTLEGGWQSSQNKIRRNMLSTGRHLDIARFNEVQQRVGLKRLLGGLGRQILESDKLSGPDARVNTLEELLELLTYNVSDVIGLEQLFSHRAYAQTFDLKKGLLDEYLETIYDAIPDTSRPDIRPGNIRKKRLTPGSSSAQFAATILAPYTPLGDMPGVSYMYPHPAIAKEWGVESVNILEETKKFFYDNITDPAARAQFDNIYKYYKTIEGMSFNDDLDENAPELRHVQKYPNNIPYFDANGQPTSAFATFSTGGIHGAEVDIEFFRAELAQYKAKATVIDLAKQHYPDPRDFIAEARRQHDTITLPDGQTVQKNVVLHGSDPEKVVWRKPLKNDPERDEQLAIAQAQIHDAAELLALQRPDNEKLNIVLDDGTVIQGKVVLANETAKNAKYREEPTGRKPELFEPKPDGSNRLKSRYAYTSAAPAYHEDFTSYYPNLLRGLNAFYNPDLGEDRYAKIFFQKEDLDVQRKAPGLSAEERSKIEVVRDGTKLILNAASGAGDAGHTNNIKMNNTIISMRILGQLFSWRIGQAQTLAGARIISTNTDGLYSAGLDEETNNRILQEQAAATGIEIEPSLLYVISKDSNNRLELSITDNDKPMWEAEVEDATGGTLACWEEPQPTKSLAHPAVLDRTLVQYLKLIAAKANPPWRREETDTPLNLNEPLCYRTGLQLMTDNKTTEDTITALRLFQHIASASVGSYTFPFLADPIDHEDDELTNLRTLQHYSRLFIVKDGTPGAASIHTAGAWKVTAASRHRRERDDMGVTTDQQALSILRELGYERTRLAAQQTGKELLPEDRDVGRRKLSRIEPTWNVIVENRDLHTLSAADARWILEHVDLEIYTEMLQTRFDKNWQRNVIDEAA